MAKKQKTLSALKKILDKEFNKFVRLRDVNGWLGCYCISCGTWVDAGRGHASHFYAGTFTATRWDERNVNLACVKCNVFLHGNLLGYRKGMLAKYGQEVLDELEELHNKPTKLERQWLMDKINEYKNKL